MYKIIISHPTGNQNNRGAIYGLYKNNLLESFHTCIALFNHNIFHYLSFIFPTIKRRSYNSAIKNNTFLYPYLEIFRILFSKFRINLFTRHEKGLFCIDKIYQNLDLNVAKYIQRKDIQCSGVYAYEDGALNSFISAKKKGLICFYDLPTIYWRYKKEIYNNEIKKDSTWATTIKFHFESNSKLKRKDEELKLADIIYVACTFAKKTLEMYPYTLNNIEIIPYGFPKINSERNYLPFKNRKIKTLFVGGLSQGKGLSYLFSAIESLYDAIELTVIGQGNLNCHVLKKALDKVNYIPSLPHDEILKCMANHDLFIFPSLFEGFGLVITEAMSQGTPVITTERTCGPDFIKHGENGWIVEAGQSESIHNLLLDIIKEPEILHKVGKAAMRTAAKRPWECYEKELVDSINRYVKQRS